MEIKLIVGAKYAVSTDSVCRVTYMRDGKEREYTTAYAGQQGYFVAQSSVAYADDENADITLFTDAPSVLVLLRGGGNIPAGYKRLEYLEVATRGQYIMPDAVLGDEIEIAFSAEYVNDTNRVVGAECSTTGNPGFAVGIASNGAFFIRVRNEAQSFTYTPAGGHGKKHVVCIRETAITVNGKVVSAADYKMPELLPVQVSLFAQIVYNADLSFNRNVLAYPSTRIFNFKNWRGGILKGDYIPALDAAGVPCMFDTVSKTAFRNAGSGQFIVGMTLNQVCGLHLPAGGGELTISVPADTPDSAVEQLRKNNPTWQIAIQYRTDDNEN